MSEIVVSIPEGRVDGFELAYVLVSLNGDNGIKSGLEKANKARWKKTFRFSPRGLNDPVMVQVYGVNEGVIEELVGQFMIRFDRLIPYKPLEQKVQFENSWVRVIMHYEIMTAKTLPAPVAIERGRIYVKVMRMKNVGESKKPYLVTIKNRKRKMSTSAQRVKDGAIMWYEEFIFPFYAREEELEFIFKTKKLKTTNICSTTIQLSDLSENEIRDRWYPVKGTENLEDAEVRIILRPISISNVGNLENAVRLNPSRITLDNNIFYPGQVVTGNAILNLGKKATLDFLKIELLGYSHTIIDNPNSTSVNSFIYLINEKTILYGRNPSFKIRKIGPGTYIWPFQFKLPKKLPPSFFAARTYKTSKTEYNVRLFVNETYRSSAESIFRVLPRYDILNMSALRFSKDGGNNAENELEIKLPNIDYFMLGQETDLLVNFRNNLSKPVKKLEVTIKQVQFFKWQSHYSRSGQGFNYNESEYWNKLFSGGSATKTKVTEFIIKPNNWPLQPGETWEDTVTISVPKNFAFSIPFDISPMYNIEYFIIFKYSLGLLKKVAKFKRRIFVVAEGVPAKPLEVDNISHTLVPLPVESEVIVGGHIVQHVPVEIPAPESEDTMSTESSHSNPADSEPNNFIYHDYNEQNEGNLTYFIEEIFDHNLPFVQNTTPGRNPFYPVSSTPPTTQNFMDLFF